MKHIAIFSVFHIPKFSVINPVQQDEFPILKGPYPGPKPPGRIPEFFAVGIVSTELNEHGSPTFLSDLSEMYGLPQYKEIRGGRIIFMKNIDSHWLAPK